MSYGTRARSYWFLVLTKPKSGEHGARGASWRDKSPEKADFAELSCCEKLADVLRFAANRGALLLVVRACFDLTKQMLRETTREGKKRGSVSSSGAPAKRPHAKRALAENGDLRGHEDVDLHIRSPKKLISLVDTHMEMIALIRRFDWRAQLK